MDPHDYFIFSVMTKHIVLCADDYGQTQAISQGIIKLIQMGRVTATSCMVNMPLWADHAKWLHPFYKQIDMGLHLNLTRGEPLSKEYKEIYHQFFPLDKLLRYALFRRLKPEVIEAECHAQIDCFANTLGFLPHFIDSHQHVHQFPIVRQALIQAYEKRLRRQHAYIRLVNGKLKFKIKEARKILIHTTGTRALKRLLTINHIPHNLSFAGTYPDTDGIPYNELFPLFLQDISNKGLIMCHPSLKPPNEEPIAKARFAEYQYLVGGRFLKDCHERGVYLTKFR